MRWEAGRTEFYVTCLKETPDCFTRLSPGEDRITGSYCSGWCNLPFPEDFFSFCLLALKPHSEIISFAANAAKKPYSFEEDTCFRNESLLLLSKNFLQCLAAEGSSSLPSYVCCPSRSVSSPILLAGPWGVSVLLQGQLGRQGSLLWSALSGILGGLHAGIKTWEVSSKSK